MMTLPEIITQLEACHFECEAGPLEMNIAFVELKQMAHNSESLRRAFGYFFPNELQLLKALVYMVHTSPVVVVNIGSGAGTSGLAFLETKDDVILHTIDITDASSPFGCLHAEREVFQAAGYGHLLNARWFQIHDDSKEVAKRWACGQADIVFIDGGHEYHEAVGDITGWLPHVRKGGYMAIHDYKKGNIPPTTDGPHPMVWEGVDKAVDELLLGKYDKIAQIESLIVFKIED